MNGCARCGGALPRFPTLVLLDGSVFAQCCSWKCSVIIRARRGDVEALAFARHFGWALESEGANA